MSKHTPGPWKISEDDCYGITIVTQDSAQNVITGDCSQNSGFLVITREDAQLIAAAPEVLQGLKDAVAFIDGLYPDNSPFWDTRRGQETLEWFNAATKAIAKAEGRL